MKTLYKVLQVFTLFTAFTSIAAPTPEKHPVDNFQIGVGTSASQKQFIFDLGLGASNPNLGVDTVLGGLNYSKNIFQFGDGLSSQKSFIANIGSGATNPKIIWNSTNSDWEFSNDGTNFTSIGSGSGGASGINLLQNGDFESGITLGWTNTGGTFASVNSGPNLLVGKKSATFLASAGGQSVQSTLYVVPNGLKSQGCAAQMMYLGGDIGLTYEVIDNSSNILASQVIQPATTPTIIALPFQCPGSGSIRTKIISSVSSSLIAFDQMFMGQNQLIQVSQANLVGTLTTTGCGVWSNAAGSTSAYQNFPVETGCIYTVTGDVLPPSSMVPGFKLASVSPGNYLVTYDGHIGQGVAGAVSTFRMVEGANIAPEEVTVFSAGGNYSVPGFTSSFTYPSGTTNADFSIQSVRGTGGNAYIQDGTYKIYRFPTQSELAVNPATINWKVDANQIGANNVALAVSGTIASLTEMTDATSALSITTNPGSLPVQIPCSGTNGSTGTTCASGTPDLGVVFNLPSSGSVRACVTHTVLSGTVTAAIQDGFDIVETPNNAQTILQQANSGSYLVFQANDQNAYMTTCGILNFASSGQKTLRLDYIFTTAGATSQHLIACDNSISRKVHWIITPITQNLPAPVLLGSVINPAPAVTQIVSGLVNATGGGCTINQSDGNAFSGCIRNSAGNYNVTFTAGVFNSNPNCTVSSFQNIADITTAINGTSNSTAQVLVNQSGSGFDGGFFLICVGQR